MNSPFQGLCARAGAARWGDRRAPAVHWPRAAARWREGARGPSPGGPQPAAGEPSAGRPRACHLQEPQPPPAAPPPSAAAAAAVAPGIGPQAPAPDRRGPGTAAPWPVRGTAASRWPSGRTGDRGACAESSALSRVGTGRGSGGPGGAAPPAARARGSPAGRAGGRRVLAGPPGERRPRGRQEGLCLGGDFGPLSGALNDQKIE